MADFYGRMRAVAKRLIDRYGRDLTVELATDSALPDPDRPWEPGAPALVSHTVRGVVFPVDSQYVDGTTIFTSDKQCLLAASDLPAEPDPKTVVTDRGTRYTTIRVEPIDTGTSPVVYTLFLKA